MTFQRALSHASRTHAPHTQVSTLLIVVYAGLVHTPMYFQYYVYACIKCTYKYMTFQRELSHASRTPAPHAQVSTLLIVVYTRLVHTPCACLVLYAHMYQMCIPGCVGMSI